MFPPSSDVWQPFSQLLPPLVSNSCKLGIYDNVLQTRIPELLRNPRLVKDRHDFCDFCHLLLLSKNVFSKLLSSPLNMEGRGELTTSN